MKIKFYFTDPLQGTAVNLNLIRQFRLLNFRRGNIKSHGRKPYRENPCEKNPYQNVISDGRASLLGVDPVWRPLC